MKTKKISKIKKIIIICVIKTKIIPYIIKSRVIKLSKKYGEQNFHNQKIKFCENILFPDLDFATKIETCFFYHLLLGSSVEPKNITTLDLAGKYSILNWIKKMKKP